MNNFQKLIAENEQELSSEQTERILQAVWGNLGFLRLLGDVADIYVSKMVDVAIMAASGSSDSISVAEGVPRLLHAPAPDQPPASPDGPPGKRGPSSPSEPVR